MKKTILIATVMFFALSVAAFAQVATFTVSSIPVTTVASCGASELSGDIVFTAISGTTPLNTGTITILYPQLATIAAGSSIKIYNGAGADITASYTVTAVANQLTIANSGVAVNTNDVIRISGVRVNIAGTGLTSVSANISGVNFAFVTGQTNPVVITNVSPALKAFGSALLGFSNVASTISVSALNGTASSNTLTINVNENFASAYVAGQIVAINVSAIPAGISLKFSGTATTTSATAGGGGDQYTTVTVSGAGSSFTATNSGADVTLTSKTTPATVYYMMTSPAATPDTSLTTVDTLPILVTETSVGPYPIPLGSVTVTANLFPPSGTGSLQASLFVPRYGPSDLCTIGPATVLNVVQAQTALLVPYAVSQGGFDTGIAIVNTTSDPGSAAGFGTVGPPSTLTVAQNGPITFYFYSQAGTAIGSYTTSATSPGAGLTSGNLNAGGTYSVLLSQLLSAAGFTGDFQGYVFAVCNFTNGHGESFVSDFVHFSQGALMLVVPQSTSGRQQAVEQLNN